MLDVTVCFRDLFSGDQSNVRRLAYASTQLQACMASRQKPTGDQIRAGDTPLGMALQGCLALSLHANQAQHHRQSWCFAAAVSGLGQLGNLQQRVLGLWLCELML